jgi:hypothetical protein
MYKLSYVAHLISKSSATLYTLLVINPLLPSNSTPAISCFITILGILWLREPNGQRWIKKGLLGEYWLYRDNGAIRYTKISADHDKGGEIKLEGFKEEEGEFFETSDLIVETKDDSLILFYAYKSTVPNLFEGKAVLKGRFSMNGLRYLEGHYISKKGDGTHTSSDFAMERTDQETFKKSMV